MAFIWGFRGFFISCVASLVLGFQYNCHRDVCDSSWQYCNDDEQRCSPCRQKHCQRELADSILNQCQALCETLAKTSTPALTTAKETSTKATSSLTSQDKPWIPSNISQLIAIILPMVVIILVFVVIALVCKVLRNQKTLRWDVEKLSSTSVSMNQISYEGIAEKQPLLEGGVQPQDGDSMTSREQDKNILARATSPPPSYATNPPSGLATSPIASPEEDWAQSMQTHCQDSDLKSGNTEDMGETNILNFKDPKDSIKLTRPGRSVHDQTEMKSLSTEARA